MYLFVDVETGGLNAETDALLELHAAVYDSTGKKLSEFSETFAPDGKLGCKALQVNGMLSRLGQGDNFEKTKRFIAWSLEQAKLKPTIVGQNVKFDLKFIESFLARQGFSGWSDLFGYHTRDTSQMAQILKDMGIYKPERVNLAALCEFFGVTNQAAHSAQGDVDATAQVFFKMQSVFAAAGQAYNNVR